MLNGPNAKSNHEAIYFYIQEVMHQILTEQEYRIVTMHCGINSGRTPMRFYQLGNMISLSYKETRELYRQAIRKIRRQIILDDQGYLLYSQYRTCRHNKYKRFRIDENAPVPDWDVP